MKHYTNIYSFFLSRLLVFFAILLAGNSGIAQCALGTPIGGVDIDALSFGVRTKVADTLNAGEYIPLENIELDFTYTVDVCSDPANTQITLYDTGKVQIGFNSADCGNDGRITFVAPASGTYYVQLNLTGCGTDAVDHDFYVRKDSSSCTIGLPFGTYNANLAPVDTRTSMSTTLDAGKYLTINNIVANTTYTLDACGDPDNTSLTLYNPSNDPIKFSSNGCGNDGEITFTAPVSGSYRLQLNIDDCGSDLGNHTVYMTKSSCSNPLISAISVTQSATCFGDTAILSFTGNLNDADHWIVYKDELGVESIDTVLNNTYEFVPLQGTRTYFVQGRGGCVYMPDASWDSLTISTTFSDANFFYSSNSYCLAESDTIPTISGVSGGTFSSLPAGLSINATTGRIDNSASTINNYKVVYTVSGTCTNSDTVDLSITSIDNVSFGYGATSFCKESKSISPIFSGTNTGQFSSSPAGLSLTTGNGSINLGTSTAGTYKVKYFTTGPCANIDSVTITINDADDASFSYSSSSYCVNGTDPTPAISGLSGGAFSALSGLSLNSTTGAIDLDASASGYYNVYYTTAGSCPTTSLMGINVNALDNANYNYGKTAFCKSDDDQLPIVYISGSFSATPAGLSLTSGNGFLDIGASTVGSYTLTYTTTGTCPNTSVKTITINDNDTATFNYSGSAYCPSASDPSPTITGISGGVFSSSPSGLVINSSTGQVDLSASNPKTYTISYTTASTCPNTESVSFTVSNPDNADFNYSKNNYCVTSSDPTPNITGLAGGAFSVSPTTGLSLNSTSGTIDVSASTNGSYDVTYTTTGSCPNTSTKTVIISAIDDASFDYALPSYCAFSTNALPTITGLNSGTFTSSPIGLSMLSNNGYINTGASNPGTYTITYTTAGDCQNSSTDVVEIIAADDATFNYDGVEYCPADTDPAPTVVGLAGGTYSSSPAGLVIDANSGVIDLSNSTSEVYTVEYTTNGSCPNSSSQSIIIDESSDAGFSYASSSYCVSGSDPSPVVTGLTGGLFSASPTGLTIDENTGVIDLSASTAGSYTVSYAVQGDCPNSAVQLISIQNLDDATFGYGSNNFCTAGTDPVPTVTGVSGGSFSATPTGLLIYSSTGEVDLDASQVGDYQVTYTTGGACPNSFDVSFKLRAFDDPSFEYGNNVYCVTTNDPTPTINGLSGGSFTSSPAGLSMSSFTGKIDVSASTPAVYEITYTTSGDCPYFETDTVTISAIDDASFAYSNTAYCETETDPVPNLTGLSGGSFVSLSAGLVIDGSTGEIDLDLSDADTYTIQYTTNGNCPNSNIQSVTVNNTDNANFTYGQPSFCSASANPYPSIQGLFGGTFASTPAGMTLDPSTGEIDISSSTLGSYDITYTTSGACPNATIENVVLNAFDDASFSYPSSVYCITNSDPTPLVTGIQGGSFSVSPSGLTFNQVTGEIDLSNSLLGVYTITYSTTGSCQNSSSQSLTVTDVDDASFSYGSSNFCVNDADVQPSISGVTGGTFTSSPAGLILDGQTGLVDISNSSSGIYSVVYTTNTNCPTSQGVSFNLRAIPNVTQTIPSCDSLELHGTTYYNTQTAIDTLSGIYCDSVVTTSVEINYANTGVDVISTWCELTWIDGNVYDQDNNTATYVTMNAAGCDSVVTLDLTLTKVDTSVTMINSTFISNESNADYQWVKCQGYVPVANATSKDFTPIQNGNYACIITKNGCTDTTACFFLTNVGIASNDLSLAVDVYPNPFNDIITVGFESQTEAVISITNIEGKEVLRRDFNGKVHTYNLSELVSGVYFVSIAAGNLQKNVKLIKL